MEHASKNLFSNLPHDFPKWQVVYFYYQICNGVNEEGISQLAEILKKSVQKIRIQNKRETHTSFLIVDAQSVKNTDTAKEKGYDSGKKVFMHYSSRYSRVTTHYPYHYRKHW